jgi:hypothetical protein
MSVLMKGFPNLPAVTEYAREGAYLMNALSIHTGFEEKESVIVWLPDVCWALPDASLTPACVVSFTSAENPYLRRNLKRSLSTLSVASLCSNLMRASPESSTAPAGEKTARRNKAAGKIAVRRNLLFTLKP